LTAPYKRVIIEQDNKQKQGEIEMDTNAIIITYFTIGLIVALHTIEDNYEIGWSLVGCYMLRTLMWPIITLLAFLTIVGKIRLV